MRFPSVNKGPGLKKKTHKKTSIVETRTKIEMARNVVGDRQRPLDFLIEEFRMFGTEKAVLENRIVLWSDLCSGDIFTTVVYRTETEKEKVMP